MTVSFSRHAGRISIDSQIATQCCQYCWIRIMEPDAMVERLYIWTFVQLQRLWIKKSRRRLSESYRQLLMQFTDLLPLNFQSLSDLQPGRGDFFICVNSVFDFWAKFLQWEPGWCANSHLCVYKQVWADFFVTGVGWFLLFDNLPIGCKWEYMSLANRI